MRKFLAALPLVIIVIAACASQAPKQATKSKVLAAAKQMSASSCRPHNVGNLRMIGCDYLATFLNNEWSVLVTVAYVDASGKRIHGNAMGVYFFSPSGTFVKFVPGM
jgi:hypothetical protein